MESELLPDGTTLYRISGDGPLRPYVFEDVNRRRLLRAVINHLMAQVDEAHALCG